MKRTVIKKATKKTILTFGKYKGKTVGDIMTINPSYLLWADETISWFKLSPNIIDGCMERVADYSIRKVISRYVEDSPYWADDDNGSWLS